MMDGEDIIPKLGATASRPGIQEMAEYKYDRSLPRQAREFLV